MSILQKLKCLILNHEVAIQWLDYDEKGNRTYCLKCQRCHEELNTDPPVPMFVPEYHYP